MSDMNGNPHYADYELDLDNATDYDNAVMQLHATLALAYEQRTANLIATLRVGAVDMTDWPQHVIDNFHRTSQEIAQRMGYPIGATE